MTHVSVPQITIIDGKNIDGRDELTASLNGVSPTPDSFKAADMLVKARKAVFVFEKNALTSDAARLIANIAVLSGHDGSKPRDGIIQLLPGANSQGLANLGVGTGEELSRAIDAGEIRGLFIFGENATAIDLEKLDFLAVQDLCLTDTAWLADIVFPASSFAETSGSFTAADEKTQQVRQAVNSPVALDNIEQIKLLSSGAGYEIPYKTVEDIRRAMNNSMSKEDKRAISLVQVGGDALYRSEYVNTNELCANLMDFASEKGL